MQVRVRGWLEPSRGGWVWRHPLELTVSDGLHTDTAAIEILSLERDDQIARASIRNAPTDLMKDMDYGKGYRYDHDFKDGYAAQEYLPDALAGNLLTLFIFYEFLNWRNFDWFNCKVPTFRCFNSAVDYFRIDLAWNT